MWRSFSTSFASDVSGNVGAVTLCPCACRFSMTGLQLEPSAQAPCTRTMFGLVSSVMVGSSWGNDDDCHRFEGTYQKAMTIVIVPSYSVLMTDRKETSQTRSAGEQQPARDRIVRSAVELVRERGVHGVGLRQIVAHADGPRGSLQR